MLEHGERAEILGVVPIGNSWDLVVIPVEEASLNSWLKSAEYFNVTKLARLVADFTAAISLVGLNLDINIIRMNAPAKSSALPFL